jgi:DNA recombination protein RmuC
MELFLGIVLVCVVLAFIAQGVFLWRMVRAMREKEQKPKDDSGLLLLQQHLQDLTRTVDHKLSENSRNVQQSIQGQLKESAQLVREVTAGLTKLDETNRQVVSFADQLQHLQDILKNPKQRGVLGEYYLETVLKNVLPPGRFQMQYRFSDGEIVDAVIFLDKDKVLPVDSKFSLENYNRLIVERDPQERERLEKLFKHDLKARIDETSKYIRPKENTMDFAFMFIPSEGVYYDLLVNQVGGGATKTSARDLIDYAFRDKKVIIVSPTSFLAYLQTVLQGLRSLQIEEGAKEIRKRVEELGRHLAAYDTYYAKLGNTLATTVNHYNAGAKELKKVDKDVLRITGESHSTGDVCIAEKPLISEDM